MCIHVYFLFFVIVVNFVLYKLLLLTEILIVFLCYLRIIRHIFICSLTSYFASHSCIPTIVVFVLTKWAMTLFSLTINENIIVSFIEMSYVLLELLHILLTQ